MKKYLSILLAFALCAIMAVAVCAADVYVNDGGTGDGSSAEAALGSMTDAINLIAEEGGTVHIVDTYTCADEYVEPEHAGDIVITGGKYVFTNGKYNRWYLSGTGSTTFENITFEYGAGTTSLFVARFNTLVMGEGITMPETSGYVIGGYQKVDGYATLAEMIEDLALATDKDSNVTVKSGSYHLVAGFCRGDDGARSTTTAFTGTSNITVTGGTMKTVYGGNINTNATSGGTNITITGGEMLGGVRTAGEAQVKAQVVGDANINISGGNIASLVVNNVLGKTNVETSGGIITNAEKTLDESLAELVVDGTATLTALEGAKVSQMLADKFDTFVGEVFVPTIPVITKPVEEVTEAPAETSAPAEETTVAPAASAEGGVNPAIIAIIAVVVVVIIVVIALPKKKK
ncbi:MAG: hypothetical protein E7598_06915 [Ruminococcaceae bacterium]|nr:hypothetical protein [Oscillospiraceae bacterium]